MSDEVYLPSDFVYVDGENRKVVGRVQWKEDGTPVPLKKPEPPADNRPDRKGRAPRVRYYPWGTYETMNRIYRLEGKKESTQEGSIDLDTAVAKLQEEPFWNNEVPAAPTEPESSQF